MKGLTEIAILMLVFFLFVPDLTADNGASPLPSPGPSDSEPAASSRGEPLEPAPASLPTIDDVIRQEEETGFSQKGARALALFVLAALVCYGGIQWQRRRVSPQDSSIKIVAVKSLGQKERVAVLEVLGEKMVVGVTTHQVSLLRGSHGLYSSQIPSGDSGK